VKRSPAPPFHVGVQPRGHGAAGSVDEGIRKYIRFGSIAAEHSPAMQFFLGALPDIQVVYI